MKPKLFFSFFLFFTTLLFGGGRLLAIAPNDTLWANWNIIPDEINFSPDDSIISVAYNTGYETVSLFNTISGNLLRSYDGLSYHKFTPNGQYLVGKLDSHIVVVRTESMTKFRDYQTGLGWISYTDIGYDGSKIFGTRGDSIGYSVWDFNTGQRIEDVMVDSCTGCIENSIYQTAVADSLNILFIQYKKVYQKQPVYRSENKFFAFDMTTKQKKYDMENCALIFSKDKKRLYLSKDSIYYRLDVATGNIIDTILIAKPADIAISNDEKYLVLSMSYPSKLEVWNLLTKAKEYTYTDYDNIFFSHTALSNNSKYIACKNPFLVMYKTPWLPTILKDPDGNNPSIIYPNPGNSEITFEFSIIKSGKSKISITDLKGEIIYDFGEQYYDKGKFSRQINTGSLQTGEYFLKMESADGIIINKIIINK